MSVEATAWAWRQEIKPPTRKMVLLYLGDCAGLSADGKATHWECFPSAARIASFVGIGRSSVFDHLAALEADGWIRRVSRDRENGSQTSTRYVLLTGQGVQLGGPPPSDGSDPSPSDGLDPLNRKEEPSHEPEADEVVGKALEVWRYWCENRKPTRTVMPKGTQRMLKRALNAGYETTQLFAAIDGLLKSDWHRERDLLNLSTIFATRPGGPVFEEQVDSWIKRGTEGGPTHGAAGANVGAIEDAKSAILQTWGKPGRANEEHRLEALRVLQSHGIDVVVGELSDRPRFVPRETA